MAEIKGKTWTFGKNIDTDVIIPGRYLRTFNPNDLAKHVLEGERPDFTANVAKGDIIVADENFGCGSSREQAPVAIKTAGVDAIVAKSFARIFYRNATNVGVPLLEAPGISKLVEQGEEIEVDMDNGTITSESGETITFKKLPPLMLEILGKGGLIEYLKEKHNQ